MCVACIHNDYILTYEKVPYVLEAYHFKLTFHDVTKKKKRSREESDETNYL